MDREIAVPEKNGIPVFSRKECLSHATSTPMMGSFQSVVSPLDIILLNLTGVSNLHNP